MVFDEFAVPVRRLTPDIHLDCLGPVSEVLADCDACLPSIGQRPPVVAEKPNAPPAADLRPEIEARLAQRVLLFEQATPVAFDTLRLQLSELASVPIDYDESLGADPAQRTAEVRLSLSDVTLADVLDEVAHAAGLDYRVDRERIRLVERTAAPTAASEIPRSDSE